jgi:signal transduction histidine kinase
MRWREKHGLHVTLGILAVLLVLLAAQQYRWVGEIGRADSERRRTQIERSAWRFSAALDRALSEPALALRVDPGTAGADSGAAVLARLAEWRRNERAGLVSGVLLALRQPRGDVTLQSCAAGAARCEPAAWTAGLEPLRSRLAGTDESRSGREGFVRAGTILDSPLGLLVPIVEITNDPAAQFWEHFRLSGLLVVRIDEAFLRERVLPQLAEAHFGPLAESEFVLAVLRRADRSILYASDATVTAEELNRSDIQISLPSPAFPGEERRGEGGRGPREGWLRRAQRGAGETARPGDAHRPPPAASGPAGGPGGFPGGPEGPAGPGSRDERGLRRRPERPDGPWLLVVLHRGGSLEAVVARVRRRNLAVGLGILGLLGAAGVVLARAADRARRLARQQIEFVAGVTHELNTPLAAIRSAGQNLKDGIVTDGAQVRRYGGLIEQEGRRLSALVAQVLDFAGIESPGRAYAADPVALGTLVDEALGELKLVLEQAGFTVEKDVPPGLPDVRGDAAALRRVLTNLLTNAVKFAASGRFVAVRAARAAGGHAVVLRVEDHGPGIPPTERKRVFEPFYRGAAAERNDTPGSGLGLSLVRRVVKAHGGRVRVEGREEGGAVLAIELPVHEEPRP